MLQFVHSVAAELADIAQQAEMALQLFLMAAYCASEDAHLEHISYEFFEQVRACTEPYCKMGPCLHV